MLGDINYPTYPSVSEGWLCLGKNEEEEHILWKELEPSLEESSRLSIVRPAHIRNRSAGYSSLIFPWGAPLPCSVLVV